MLSYCWKYLLRAWLGCLLMCCSFLRPCFPEHTSQCTPSYFIFQHLSHCLQRCLTGFGHSFRQFIPIRANWLETRVLWAMYSIALLFFKWPRQIHVNHDTRSWRRVQISTSQVALRRLYDMCVNIIHARNVDVKAAKVAYQFRLKNLLVCIQGFLASYIYFRRCSRLSSNQFWNGLLPESYHRSTRTTRRHVIVALHTIPCYLVMFSTLTAK